MKTVLCFGDSNTHGTQPMAHPLDHRRFGPHQRWPGVLAQQLGEEWQVLEEGLPGRTLAHDDPVEGEDRNALRYLRACLQSHAPLDAVVVMLGTNDHKARFGLEAVSLANGLHPFIDVVRAHTTAFTHMLVICPPAVVEVGCLKDMFDGGASRSVGLPAAMQTLCERRGVTFMDANQRIQSCDLDGIHLDEEAHRILGLWVAEQVVRL